MLIRTVALGEPIFFLAPDDTLFKVTLEAVSMRNGRAAIRIDVERGAVTNPHLGAIESAYFRLDSSNPVELNAGGCSIGVYLVRMHSVRARLGFRAPNEIRISHSAPPRPLAAS